MSNRRSTLATEEGVASESPLRRSTRIANSPAPAAAAPAPVAASVGRRRSSAAESSVSTPAKISRVKRTSLSHEITLGERPQTPTKRAAAKTTRGASKSPSAEPEIKEVGTPAKRGRRPSITKVKEEEAAAAKPATPSRRRSVRASVSPSTDAAAESAAPKPRGRRASVTQASLEAIKEAEAKPDPKVARPLRAATRRASAEAAEEPEAKKEERKPPTRRSVRGRSASVDEPAPEAKPTPELVPINEEEPDVEVAEKQTDAPVESTAAVDDKSVAAETAKDKDFDVIEIVDDPDDAEVAETNRRAAAASMVVVVETRTPTPARIASPSPSPKTRQSDAVFKPPVVRRSPRFSPDKKTSPQNSPLADVAKADTPVTSPAVATASPRRSLRLSESCEDDLDLKVETSARQSPRVSGRQSSVTDKEQASPKEKTAAPSKSSVSESVQAVQATSDASVETVDDVEEEMASSPEKAPTRRSTRLSESLDAVQKRKSVASPLSQSLDETSATPSADARREVILKRTPELVSGSDGSFRLNISIPATCSIDDDDERERTAALNRSGGSTSSDKENKSGKLNAPKSPARKRVSLSDTSTPKLNSSIKMQSFCEPIEVEFATTDVVVAAAKAPASVEKVPGKRAETSQNASAVEVDNQDEFGTSPVKALRPVAKDADRTEEELMSSFVDEVIDLDTEADKAATEPKKNDTKSQAETKAKEDENDETSTVKKPVDADGKDADVDNANDDGEEEAIKAEGGSKRRKVLVDEITSKGLDDLIDANLMDVAEVSDEEDSDYNPFVDDMASEGEEDTPSEDSNQIIDEGESLHSSESDVLCDDDDYENDSFITDGECDELLSGSEYDLADLQSETKKKKKRLRVIRIVDSSDEEVPAEKAEEKLPALPELKRPTSAVVAKEVKGVDQQPEEAVVKAEPKRKTPVKNAKEDDKAPEEDVEAGAMKKKKTPVKKAKSEDDEVLEDATAVSIKVDNFVHKDDPVSGGNKIIVLQNIKVSPAKELSDTSVVINEEDNLKSLESMKETLQPLVPRDPKPSLSTPNNSMIEPSGQKTRRRTSINIQDQIKINRYSDVEISDKITKAVDFFVSSIKEKSGNVSVNVSLDYANNSSAEEGSPKRPRISFKSDDGEEILDTTVDEIRAKSNASKVPKKRRSDVRYAFAIENVDDDAAPASSKRIKTGHVEASEAKAKGAKKRCQEAGNDAKEERFEMKNKLNRSLGDAKTKTKKQRRSGVKESSSLEIDGEDVADEPEAKRSPLAKKKSKNVKAAIVVPTPTAKASDPDIRIQVEMNPHTTKSEMSVPFVSGGVNRKFKKVTPSATSNYGWSVEEAGAVQPSKRNKNRKVPVKEQIERLKKKMLPNDFKNQMIYGAHVKRMDSQAMIKNKQKAGHSKRK